MRGEGEIMKRKRIQKTMSLCLAVLLAALGLWGCTDDTPGISEKPAEQTETTANAPDDALTIVGEPDDITSYILSTEDPENPEGTLVAMPPDTLVPSKFEDLPACGYEKEVLKCPYGDGYELYGEIYRPEKDGKVPLVIYAYGFNGQFSDGKRYGELLASHGIAVYCFDFRGGNMASSSGGDFMEMSVMTEAADLGAVIEAASGWDFVDPDKIAVIGLSMGGEAAAIAVGRHPDQVAALVLLAPALGTPDAVRSSWSSPDEIPEVLYGGSNDSTFAVGRNFYADCWDVDEWEEISHFTGPVLLIHGTADQSADFGYTVKARRTYENAVMYAVEGGGHGIYDTLFEYISNYIYAFFRENGLI